MLLKAFEFCFPKRKAIEIDLSSHDEELRIQKPIYNLDALELYELKDLQRLKLKVESKTKFD